MVLVIIVVKMNIIVIVMLDIGAQLYAKITSGNQDGVIALRFIETQDFQQEPPVKQLNSTWAMAQGPVDLIVMVECFGMKIITLLQG